MSNHVPVSLAWMTLLCVPGLVQAQERPVAVSPGDATHVENVVGACPTFSWGGVSGAERYEIVVYRSDRSEEEPVLMRTIPAAALSWTPPSQSCLEPAGSYAWSVRAVTAEGAGRWSSANLFRISPQPSAQEVEAAVAVLRRYVAAEKIAPIAAEATVRADAGAVVETPPASIRSEVPGDSRREPAETGTVHSPPRSSLAGPTRGVPAPTLGAASLTVDGQIHLGIYSQVFKNDEVLLWDLGSNLALGLKALTSNTSGSLNTALGYRALETNTTGAGNTAIGTQALYKSVDGTYNTAAGNFALMQNADGYRNTAVGWTALQSNISGNFNTAIGEQALRYNTSGQNVAIGAQALRDNTTGFWNTATGAAALRENTTGRGNTGHGGSALRKNTTASYNSAFGYLALYDTQTGANNTAMGAFALRYTTASRNVGVGYKALRVNTTGYRNVAVGSFVLDANIGGDRNAAVGDFAMSANTSGYRNVAMGPAALFSNTTGSRNIGIGNRAGYNATTGDDNIFIGNTGVAGESDTIRIGDQATHSDAYIAGIFGNIVAGSAVLVTASGELGVAPSSHRFKTEIADMNDASRSLLALRPVIFEYREGLTSGSGGVEFGLIAEEVAEVLPELVTLDAEDRPYSVKYRLLSSLLLNEFQRLHRRTATLEAALMALALGAGFWFAARRVLSL